MRSAVVAFVIAFVVVIVMIGSVAMGHHRTSVHMTQTTINTLEEFHAVHANGPMDVNVSIGSTPSIEFHARAEIMPYLTAEVKNGALEIGMRDNNVRNPGEITATVVAPKLDEVTLSGSGNVEVQGIKATDFTSLISGSGNVTLNGTADSLSLDLTGSGNLDTKELHVTKAKVSLEGSGNIDVNAKDKLDATLTGSGNITYVGKPADLQRHIFGSGNVGPEDE
ncbi:MAG TPA: head GIN domain-containing protein [Fimbriimonadaceae bacterium]|nr:head GIN domain-containing protein [Fimbriimonadaceae bacterium]